MKNMPNNDFYLFKDRIEWRNWLEENYNAVDELWLGYYKKHTGKISLTYNDAVEEALCYGWIDSKIKRVDENIYKQKYTPRKKNSVWSLLNVRRIEKLIKEGKMTLIGMEKVDEAKKSGKWKNAYGKNKEVAVPNDLLIALKANKSAFKNFFFFTLSVRNRYAYWINQAKRKETREKRIQDVLTFSKQNIKPGF